MRDGGPRRAGRYAARLAMHHRLPDEEIAPPECELCQAEAVGQLLLPGILRECDSYTFWKALSAEAHAVVEAASRPRLGSSS